MNKEKAFENLKDVSKILKGHDIKYWLEAGTCLGAYREKDFIAHDTDIDIGINADDCNNVGSNADFTQCSQNPRLQYSGKINSIIYSETENIGTYTITEQIKSLFTTLINWITGIQGLSPEFLTSVA